MMKLFKKIYFFVQNFAKNTDYCKNENVAVKALKFKTLVKRTICLLNKCILNVEVLSN